MEEPQKVIKVELTILIVSLILVVDYYVYLLIERGLDIFFNWLISYTVCFFFEELLVAIYTYTYIHCVFMVKIPVGINNILT